MARSSFGRKLGPGTLRRSPSILEVEEVIDGDYETIFAGSDSDYADWFEFYHSIPYGPDRYFRMTVNFTAGPDKPETVTYFST